MLPRLIATALFFVCTACASSTSSTDADNPSTDAGSDVVGDVEQPETDTAEVVFGNRETIATVDDWVQVEALDDPFEDRPATVDCPFGFGEEDGTFELETDKCDYLVVAQPLGADLRPGDRIEMLWWHLDLWAPERAEGHIALATDSGLLWELHVPIPGDPDFRLETIDVPHAAQAGETLYLHIHNHGTNSWRVQTIEVLRPETQ